MIRDRRLRGSLRSRFWRACRDEGKEKMAGEMMWCSDSLDIPDS
jgi:hypothetical protein